MAVGGVDADNAGAFIRAGAAGVAVGGAGLPLSRDVGRPGPADPGFRPSCLPL